MLPESRTTGNIHQRIPLLMGVDGAVWPGLASKVGAISIRLRSVSQFSGALESNAVSCQRLSVQSVSCHRVSDVQGAPSRLGELSRLKSCQLCLVTLDKLKHGPFSCHEVPQPSHKPSLNRQMRVSISSKFERSSGPLPWNPSYKNLVSCNLSRFGNFDSGPVDLHPHRGATSPALPRH